MATRAVAPAGLTCEYEPAPLAIHEAQPRLSWRMPPAARRGARPSAYRILVASTPSGLRADRGDLWDSGRVRSTESVLVPYAGPPLPSRGRAFWKVRVWDERGRGSAWSRPAAWEAGLLRRSDWRARWIAGPLAGDRWTGVPCPYLRREFVAPRGRVARARLYVAALGLYECRLNGRRVGGDELAPGWTEYAKRVPYRVYDAGALVRPGDNVLAAVLGDGWYCGRVGWWGRRRYGDRPRLLAQLVLDFADGRSQVVPSDEQWQVAYGPLLHADLQAGEAYNAQAEFPGWDEPGFDAGAWGRALVVPDPGIEVSPALGPPVRRQETLRPVAAPARTGSNTGPRWIFDFGQNLVGRVRLRVEGPAGTTVTLRHAEMLKPDGTLYTENLRGAACTDHYTLAGRGVEEWEPRFTCHGFRYVEVSGWPGEPSRDSLAAVVLHSDVRPRGAFRCSNALLNRLQHNIEWGLKGNFVEVPTDCPQRDERLGWTGDAQVFVRTAAFNRDVAGFFAKWQRDIADAQAADGAVPATVPHLDVVGPDGGPAWADAAVICPWTIYLCHGDRRLLERHYDSLCRFVGYLEATARDGIRAHPETPGWKGFGDWLALDGSGRTEGGTPKDLIGTAYFAHSARLLGRIAGVLGRAADAERFERLFARVREAFQRRFVASGAPLLGGTQTGCVLALHFDLLPAGTRPAVFGALVADLERRGPCLTTGFVGTSYLPFVLSDGGRTDLAYALLNRTAWPSWLYAVTQGATTVWERWNGWTAEHGFADPGMNSFNHYAYGAIGAWLYAVVAGLDLDPERPGGRRLVVRPRPGGGLVSAEARLATPCGRAAVAWRLRGARIELRVEVPPGATAEVRVPTADPASVREGGRPLRRGNGIAAVARAPDAVVAETASGRYRFSAAWSPGPGPAAEAAP